MIKRPFKPGDRVMYIGADPERTGELGRVTSTDGETILVQDGRGRRKPTPTRVQDLMRIDERSRS